MKIMQLRDLPSGDTLPFFSWTDCGEGELMLIRYYSAKRGEIVCGSDSFATRTFLVCPTDLCYSFDSQEEQSQYETLLRDRLKARRMR